jgi:hypothetical protein
MMDLSSRTRAAVVVALSIVVAVGAGAPAASAAARKTRNVACALTLFATIKQPAPTAANFGSARCSRPFGTGVQRDSSKTTRTSLTAGRFTGPFKLFFDRGTIRGTFRIRFVTMLSAAYQITGVVYRGTLRITGGTAAYRRVRGTGTIVGTSPDAVRTSLSYRMKLTGVPPPRRAAR